MPDRPAWAQGPEWEEWVQLGPNSVACHAVGFDWLIQQGEYGPEARLLCSRFGYCCTSQHDSPADALEAFRQNLAHAELEAS
jgi:hypothetical protein